MLNLITSSLQNATKISVGINTKLFGVSCKIYYPKDIGHYSGQHDDVEYNDVEDDEMLLLIPTLLTQTTQSKGVYDTLHTDEFVCYTTQTLNFPRHTKIVALTETNGVGQFKVENTETINTHVGEILHIHTLSPFMSIKRQDDELLELQNELQDDYDIELEEFQATDDQDISKVSEVRLNANSQKFKYKKIT